MFEEDLTGKTIGGCRIEKLLGRGGMGSVYKAKHLNLDIPVALKLLSEQMADNPQLVERFILEARAAARLDSPHIVRVMQVGEEQGLYFIQMEFVEGESLAEKLKRQAPLEMGLALEYLYQVAKGLEVAHGEGIVHRDIKPENIMITSKEILKIADFGLAKSLQSTSGLTQSGQILGTPYYLPPEQCDGRSCDARSDLYSLGVTFFYMITGQLPFQGDTPIAIAAARLRGDPPSPRAILASISPEIEALTLKMMARLPEQRYPNMNTLMQEISKIHGQSSRIQTARLLPSRPKGNSATTSTDRSSAPTQVGVGAVLQPTIVNPTPSPGVYRQGEMHTKRREYSSPPSQTDCRNAFAGQSKRNFPRTASWAIEFAVALCMAFVGWKILAASATPARVVLPEWKEYCRILGDSSPKKELRLEQFVKQHNKSPYAVLLNELKHDSLDNMNHNGKRAPEFQLDDPHEQPQIKKIILNLLKSRDYPELMDRFGGNRKLYVDTIADYFDEDPGFRQDYQKLLSKEKRRIEKLMDKGQLGEAKERIDRLLKMPMREFVVKKLDRLRAKCAPPSQNNALCAPLPQNYFFTEKGPNGEESGARWSVRQGKLCNQVYPREGKATIQWELPSPPFEIHLSFVLKQLRRFLSSKFTIIFFLKDCDTAYRTTFQHRVKKNLIITVRRREVLVKENGNYAIEKVPIEDIPDKNSMLLELRNGKISINQIKALSIPD